MVRGSIKGCDALPSVRERAVTLVVLDSPGEDSGAGGKVMGSKSLIPAAIFFQEDYSAKTLFVVFEQHERPTNVSLQGLVKDR